MAKSEKENSQNSTTREEWLKKAANLMSSWYDDLGFPLPKYEIQSGFPSSGQRSNTVAESWTHDNGASFVLIVRPDQNDSLTVGAAIAQQLCSIAAGPKDQFGHLFQHLAISIGLRGKKFETPPGQVFKELFRPIEKTIGSIPESETMTQNYVRSGKQTTRLIKVSCNECGYVARVSRKWIEKVGPPLCPKHGPMTPEDKN